MSSRIARAQTTMPSSERPLQSSGRDRSRGAKSSESADEDTYEQEEQESVDEDMDDFIVS